MRFIYAKGATPLSPDEIYNLKPTHLTTQKELDEWEQYNIVKAEGFFVTKKNVDILNIQFAQGLHYKMFNETWNWAGKFRKTQTNIGVESIYIAQELKILFDDVKFCLDNAIYPLREIGVRLHHRMVFIHPFPNGNGRFSRLLADLFLHYRQETRYLWGESNLVSDSEVRQRYLVCLRKADNGHYADLIWFADS